MMMSSEKIVLNCQKIKCLLFKLVKELSKSMSNLSKGLGASVELLSRTIASQLESQ